MGLCLSLCGYCGQAQHKAAAAVAAVSISRHSSDDAQHDDPCTSHPGALKKFWHLHKHGGGGSEHPSCTKLYACPSVDDSVVIPPSSELFSLPSDGSDSEESRSPSSARGSVASSVTRSSVSSRLRSNSPRPRLPGRLSSFRPPSRARKSHSTTPERKSCSLGQVVPEPPMHTIARSEKLCDAHELLCLANEHAGGIVFSPRRSASREAKALDVSEARVASNSCCAAVAALAQLKAATSLPPLDNSVDCEDENCASRGDVAAAPAHEEVGEPEEYDDEKLQFTDFEATFELPAPNPSEETTASDESESQRNQPPRSALTDAISAATLVTAPAPVVQENLGRSALKAKRGGSRSLDLQTLCSSLSPLEFDHTERWRSSSQDMSKGSPSKI